MSILIAKWRGDLRKIVRKIWNTECSAVTDETVYDLASVTKATATLPRSDEMYDQKMRLCDPLRKFVFETRGSNKAITIQELLFHESGIVPSIPYYIR